MNKLEAAQKKISYLKFINSGQEACAKELLRAVKENLKRAIRAEKKLATAKKLLKCEARTISRMSKKINEYNDVLTNFLKLSNNLTMHDEKFEEICRFCRASGRAYANPPFKHKSFCAFTRGQKLVRKKR